MPILGLGSNIGDRLANLRDALNAIQNIPHVSIKRVSPVYISDALLPENAPPQWSHPHLNAALKCETTLTPLELLGKLKAIEQKLGREVGPRWSPRVIDIDILAWENIVLQTEDLHIPHKSLIDRPFALWPLADLMPLWKFPQNGDDKGKTAAQLVEKWGSRFTGNAPLQTRQIYQRIDTPQLVGIVNMTPDSFSDGGDFLNHEEALQHIFQLVNSGAEIIDIGAESTSPEAKPISPEEEWQRLLPLLLALKTMRQDFIIPPKLSLDTRHAAVAEQALYFDIEWINDVSGLDNQSMRELVASTNIECIVMHHVSIPERRDNVLPRHEDPIKLVYNWCNQRINELEQQGIAKEKIILDPGIGFGKMAEQSLAILKNIDVFKNLGVRVLVGHSRKTFLSLLSGLPFADRDIETTTISLYLAKHKVDYLRVHNVEMCARAFRVATALGEI